MKSTLVLNKNNQIFLLLFLSLFVLALIGLPHLSRNGGTEKSGLSLPAMGVWNGFNNHLNELECANLSHTSAVLHFTVIDFLQNVLGERAVEIASYGSAVIDLNEYKIKDNYGTVRIDAVGGDASSINCHTNIYRKNQGTDKKEFSYAFSTPVQKPLRGVSAGLFNSISPDVANNYPVYNWLSIYNPSDEPFSAFVRVYRHDGSYDARQSFSVRDLAPGDRRDYALGHETGQVVGMYRIVPENNSKKYGAFLSRYGRSLSGDYSFGFMLLASKGLCSPEVLPASTMGYARNWGEIANISDKTVRVNIKVESKKGVELFSEIRSLPPRSQHHLFLNPYLGESNVGALKVSCVDPLDSEDSLLVQSNFYGYRDLSRQNMDWAYASQARGSVVPGDLEVPFLIDTSYGAANWLKISSDDLSTTAIKLRLFDQSGAEITSKYSNLGLKGTRDIPIHEEVGFDFRGTAVLSTTLGSSFSSEIIRVYGRQVSPGESEIGLIMNMRLSALENDPISGDDNGGGGDGSDTTQDQDGDGVPSASDCAPTDASKWRNQAYLDADRDGIRENNMLQLVACYGNTVPAGYTLATNGPDNCPVDFNPDQLDTNNNGDGDACEISLFPSPTPSPKVTPESQRLSFNGLPLMGVLANPASFSLTRTSELKPDWVRINLNNTFNDYMAKPDSPIDWTVADRDIAKLKDSTLFHMFVLNTKLDGEPVPFDAEAKSNFLKYVRQFSIRYGSKIAAFQFGNELTHSENWIETDLRLAKLFKNFCSIVRINAPETRIVFGGFRGSPLPGETWEQHKQNITSMLNTLVQEGTADCIDALDFHYHKSWQRAEMIHEHFKELRRLFYSIPELQGVPIVNSENTGFTGPFFKGAETPENQSTQLVQSVYVGLSYRIRAMMAGLTLDHADSSTQTRFRNSGIFYRSVRTDYPDGPKDGPKPAALVHRMMGDLLRNTKPNEVNEDLSAPDGVRIIRVDGDKPHVVLWHNGDQKRSVEIDLENGVYDLVRPIGAPVVNWPVEDPIAEFNPLKRFVLNGKAGFWLEKDKRPLFIIRKDCSASNNPNETDTDGDGIIDDCELDIDGDGVNYGNDCAENDPTKWRNKAYPDKDRDGVRDSEELEDTECYGDIIPFGYTSLENGPDNCLGVTNPNQEDADNNGVGDPCEPVERFFTNTKGDTVRVFVRQPLVNSTETFRDKNLDENDTAYIAAFFAYAGEQTRKRIILPRGTYHVRRNELSHEMQGRREFFELRGKNNLLIDGNGSLILSEDPGTFIFIKDGNRIKIENFKLKHNYRMASKGFIRSENGNKYVEVAPAYRSSVLADQRHQKLSALFHWADNSPRRDRWNKNNFSRLTNTEEKFTYNSSKNAFLPLDNEILEDFSVGDPVIIRHYEVAGFGFQASGGNNISFVGNQIYSVPGRGFSLVGVETGGLIMNNKIGVHPDYPLEFVSATRDGAHSSNSGSNIIVINNEFTDHGDDSLNIHGLFYQIVSVNGKRVTYRGENYKGNVIGVPPVTGESFALRKPSLELKLITNVARVISTTDETYVVELEDTPVNVVPGDTIEQRSYLGNTFYVSNNIFKNNHGRGILVTARRGIIKNNQLINPGNIAIRLVPDNGWHMVSGLLHDVAIRNNHIHGGGHGYFRTQASARAFGAISIGTVIKDDNGFSLNPVHSKIEISNNTIEHVPTQAIHVFSAREVEIKGNKITDANQIPFAEVKAGERINRQATSGSVFIHETRDLTVSRNEFFGSSGGIEYGPNVLP